MATAEPTDTFSDDPVGLKEEKIIQESREFAFQEQCFLSHNRQQIFKMLEKKTPLTEGPTPRQKLLENDHVISWYSAAGPAGASALMSRINAYDGAQEFFNLDSSILTQLKPIVELYKVYPDIKWGSTGDELESALPLKIKLPLGEQINFDPDGSRPENSNEVSNLSAIEEVIFRPNNVLGNAMLTDLQFAFTGKNVALLNTVEDVNFTINFSSANVFFHKFVDTYNPPAGTGLSTPASTQEVEYSFMDLISFTTKYIEGTGDPSATGFNENSDDAIRKCNTPSAEFKDIRTVSVKSASDTHFEIQLTVRYDPEDIDWNLVRLSGHRVEDGQEAKVKSFLRNSAISMRLQLASHTINYSGNSGAADPGLKINFNFKAYIESALGSSDLDLFRIVDSEAEGLRKTLEHLAKVRTLLKRIKDNKLTLETGFEDETTRKTYSDARSAVENEIAATNWAIKFPSTPNGTIASNIILSPKDRSLMKLRRNIIATNKAKPPHERITIDSNPVIDDLNNRLFKDSGVESKGTGGTAVLLIVFRELEENLGSLIKYYRRRQISEAYGQFFKNLWDKHRMYQVATKILNIQTPGQEAPSQSDMAKKRNALITEVSGLEVLGPNPKGRGFPPMGAATAQQKKGVEANENAQEIEERIIKAEDRVAGPNKIFSKPTTPDRINVKFTTLGDIIDVAIDIATRGKGLYRRRMGIILGPVGEGEETPLSLADVPISLRMLMGFWIKKVVVKDRQTYMLGDFIKDIISDLILPSLGSRCVDGGDFETDYTLGTTTFTSEMTPDAPFYPKKRPGTDYPEAGGASRVKFTGGTKFVQLSDPTITLPWFNGRAVYSLTNVAPSVPLEKQFNYMLLYIRNFSIQTRNPKKEEKNIEDGIYYLKIAKLPSPVLQASFAKEPIKYLREARVAGQLTKTGGLALRDVYRFSCTMYGNNIFKPGMHVFVDPTRDGSTYSQWADLGIGGFYLVIGVTHSVLEGNSAHHLTSLTCKWEDFGCTE